MPSNSYPPLKPDWLPWGLVSIEHLCYSGSVDTLEKLAISSNASCFEQDSYGFPGPGSSRAFMPASKQPHGGQVQAVRYQGHEIPIYRAALPGGGRSPLLKAMLTTACERHCRYCSFQSGRDMRRVTLQPDEMAAVYSEAHAHGLVQGLFLSTGLFGGGANTQNKLLDCARLLRAKHGYRGYIHLKLMPGSEFGQVERAMQLADRVSINLEAPNAARLEQLAPEKQFSSELLDPLRWAARIRRERSPEHTHKGRWASTSTQFVVGPAGESDLELLSTVERLLKQLGLRRTYFEAFTPVPGTPFEHLPAENPIRQQRLYEASYLLRDYGFDLEDLSFSPDGRLPLGMDPKYGYAEQHLTHQPVEINLADREQLLRVPGIGPAGSERILQRRTQHRLTDLNQLRQMGIVAERAAPYILLDGRSLARQLPLFASEDMPA